MKTVIFFAFICFSLFFITLVADATAADNPLSGTEQSGANYVGAAECMTCHEATYQVWSESAHNKPNDGVSASFLDKTVRDTPFFELYGGRCRSCHVVGEDTSLVGAANDGYRFDEAYDTDYNKTRTGIQCENCHGPGSKHVQATESLDRIKTITAKPSFSDTCINCHTSGSYKRVWSGGASEEDVSKGIPHHPQNLVYGGGGGFHYGQADLPMGSHSALIENGCVSCHLNGSQSSETHSLGIDQWDLESCKACHKSDFSMANITAYQAAITIAVEAIEEKLNELKSAHYDESAEQWDDAAIKLKYDKANWNAHLIKDGSTGIHNPPYAAELIRLTMEDLKQE